MKILANKATVATASIEVKTLTLNKKQVTLSVFRQIDSERPRPYYFDDTDNNTCTPVEVEEVRLWGRVNYCPEKCPDIEHVHFLWETWDMRLKRCTLFYPGNDFTYLVPMDQDEFKMALDGSRGLGASIYGHEPMMGKKVLQSSPETDPYVVDFKEEGRSRAMIARNGPKGDFVWVHPYESIIYTNRLNRRQTDEKAASRLIGWVSEYEKERLWRLMLWHRVTDAPQLFIAV